MLPVEVEHLRLEHLLATEGQELSREVRRASRRLLDELDMTLEPGVAVQAIRQQRAAARDDAEEIVEIVGHAPGQPAHGFHLLGLGQLLLGPGELVVGVSHFLVEPGVLERRRRL